MSLASRRGAAAFWWWRAVGRAGERVPFVYELDAAAALRRLRADRARHDRDDDPGLRALGGAERSEFSQNGEDGVIAALLERIGETNRWFVEIGASDAGENCTRRLASLGWNGVWVEADPEAAARARLVAGDAVTVVAEPAYRDSVAAMLTAAGVPDAPDVLVVDIDSDDLGVLTACLARFSPRIVVAEYNGAFGPGEAWSLPDRYGGGWDGTFRHGASLRALADAVEPRGYRLVYCDRLGVNAFFVRTSALDESGVDHDDDSTARRVARIFRAPAFTAHPFGHPRSGAALAPMPALTLDQAAAITFGTVRLDGPATVEAGAIVAFDVEITNGAATTLTSGGPTAFHLSARWLDADGSLPADAPRLSLPFPLAPGSTRRVRLWLPAPEASGRHTVRVTGVCEQLAWCESLPGDRGHADATVVVR